ncbi:MAG: Flp family type IVb pilin [Alphaproteobacteria bacterium]|nr:Flp family type IVb pilin [Alphaproteobacteria bacterium]
MSHLMRVFLRAENGATAIEYGMIAGLVFLAIVGAVQVLGQTVLHDLFLKISTVLAS